MQTRHRRQESLYQRINHQLIVVRILANLALLTLMCDLSVMSDAIGNTQKGDFLRPAQAKEIATK